MLSTMSGQLLRLSTRWGALSMLIVGCSASTAQESSPNEGGQTGSLVPPTCQEESANAFVVPEGQTAFVEGWHEFSNPVLRDANGNVIPTSTTADEGTTLLQTAEPLIAGDYTLTYDCAGAVPLERTISVAEPAPLPTSFGELELVLPVQTEECSDVSFVSLDWTPPGEFLPYLDLVQLAFSVDGKSASPVLLTEPLTAALDGVVRVNIPSCERFGGDCGFTSGRYALTAKIAGREGQWRSPEVIVDGMCERTSESLGCAVTQRHSISPRWAFSLVGACIWGLRRAKHRRLSVVKL